MRAAFLHNSTTFMRIALLVLLLAGALSACGNDPVPSFRTDLGDTAPSADGGADGSDVVIELDLGVPDAPPFVGSDDGEPCSVDAECAGEVCMPEPVWQDGYCTTRPCASDDECSAPDVICSSFENASMCLLTCTTHADCRDGYFCGEVPGRPEFACLPGEPPVVVPTGNADGEPCEADSDCVGGTCIEPPDWPGGYCTTLECTNFEDCARGAEEEFDNRCLIQQRTNFCVRICREEEECRAGYTCQGLGGGLGFCAPGFAPPSEEVDLLDHPFDIVCGITPNDRGVASIDFSIDEGTSAYMITPFAAAGGSVSPVGIDLPDGGEVDLDGANGFQLTPSILFGFINPIVIPATPQDEDLLQSGDHTLRVETNSEDLCYYLLQESGGGSVIDLNVYLVGLPDVDAASAPADPNFIELFDAFEEIYAQAGVSIGELRFIDPPRDVIDTYQIIRSQAAAEALVTETTVPGTTVDDAISMNVFFTRSFAFSNGQGVLGISMGLPGGAGLHGTRASGVAFTGEFIGSTIPGEGSGNRYTGIVLAHEVGHFLGLFHTSEQFGAGFDPLADTPQCRNNFPNGCPDIDNLMFPLAGISHTELSDGQSWQIRVSPLTKE